MVVIGISKFSETLKPNVSFLDHLVVDIYYYTVSNNSILTAFF